MRALSASNAIGGRSEMSKRLAVSLRCKKSVLALRQLVQRSDMSGIGGQAEVARSRPK